MHILHIDCSPRPASHSRDLSAGLVARLLADRSDASVTRRDLGSAPVRNVEEPYATALSAPAMLASASAEALDLSERLIVEVEAADIIVIGTPMHNFTVPSTLKSWIDQIVRVGRTFAPVPDGKRGLLRDRPVFVTIASGGFFGGESANQPDFLTPYLTAVLGCIGLHQLHFLPLQGTAFLAEEQLDDARDALYATLESELLVA